MMDFTKQVIDASRTKPVVVDFWAPWCGPCKFLGPIIEGLANESDGKWELVKVNTDENPEISKDYRIQGIPAVKMFYDGEVVAEFTGALPRHQIEHWLEQNLPDKRKKEFNQIIKDIGDKDPFDLGPIELFVESNPDYLEARVVLARLLAFKQPVKAVKLVENVKPGNPLYPQVEDVLAIEALVNCKIEENGNLAGKINLAKKEMEDGNIDNALEELIQAVIIDKEYCDELPRKSVIAIFNLLGNDHPLTKQYRKRFDMALY
jgi:putative thioredoxin